MAQVAEIDVGKLYVGKCNVRKSAGDITELANSIEEKGLLQPITVRPVGDKYEVIIGRRRYEACRAVGLKKIPAIIKEMDDTEAIVTSLIENIERGDLELEEEAEAYLRLLEIYGSQSEVARQTRISQHRISAILTGYRLSVETGKKVKFRPSEEERRKGKAIPFKHAEMVEEAFKTELVKKLPEKERTKKKIELVKEVAPLPQYEAKKVINHFKIFPEKPIKVIKEEALARETGVTIHVYFAPRIARALSKASQDRNMTMEELVPIAVEEWLKQVGYL